jgi:GalNAc5-diNAcBac-PP-undecaprenol beta-1,3-glucosyltransferase
MDYIQDKNHTVFVNALIQKELQMLFEKAIVAHTKGEQAIAKDLYLSILRFDELNEAALNNISLLEGDPKEALMHLGKALSVNPNNIDALINLAARLIEIEDFNAAGEILDRAKRIGANDSRIRAIEEMIPHTKLGGILAPDNPFFSVIIPTHKRSYLLQRALKSISDQTLADRHEVIVVSDSVDAETDQVCRTWLRDKDTYIRRAGEPGPSASRNLGLQIARGDYILFLDDDDAWHSELLESLEIAEPIKNGDLVYFNSTVVKESRRMDGPIRLGESFFNTCNVVNEEIYVKNQIHMSCLAIPRILTKGIQFDTHMRAYEDWDFILSILEKKPMVHAPILGSIIFEVDDQTSDRRGSSPEATDYNAVLDYLYVYRRHKTTEANRIKRSKLLESVGLKVDSNYL